MIARAADRILELKTFAYRDHVLWKTLARTPRVLSGAGHGMSGIAEALYAAADVCGDDRYVSVADEALDYELCAHTRYEARFGTWADLRDFPPKKYMHGYCAGAPGTGIMARRMMDAGRGGERARMLAELAGGSVRSLPLNPFDHLCCGNAAIAEYYLTVADREAAGRALVAPSRQSGGLARFASSDSAALPPRHALLAAREIAQCASDGRPVRSNTSTCGVAPPIALMWSKCLQCV